MAYFKQDELIVLLGAGASMDAGIPGSAEMIRKVEELIEPEERWSDHRELYHFVRSSIYYGDGVRGVKDTSFNIERLVNSLEELVRKERHPLYPFVGSWIPRLQEVSGSDFQNVRDLRDDIVSELRNHWLNLDHPEDAEYYAQLQRLQQEYEHPLRVFSLNYDMCVEQHCTDVGLERGFENYEWDWQRFELTEKDILLYKLHGSTDWYREDGILKYKNSGRIQHGDVEIIFGTTQKMQYADPFLFFAYELRKWMLSKAKLIVCVGYGFADPHINTIIGQGLKQDKNRRLLSVAPTQRDDERTREIAKLLKLDDSSQVICYDTTAASFMRHDMTIDWLSDQIPGGFGGVEDLF